MISTIYYVGSLYERETAGSTTTHRHHLYAGGQAIGQLKRTQAGVNSFEYFHRDHQGSVTKVTNGAGSVIQSLSFDAFGKRRNTDWSVDTAGNRFSDTHATKLGYTGHEHLDNVRLIHMNGRVQDPTLGRFLSPDPFVQNPTHSQNYDRFGYTYNNPLSYTDPTGFIALGLDIEQEFESPSPRGRPRDTGPLNPFRCLLCDQNRPGPPGEQRDPFNSIQPPSRPDRPSAPPGESQDGVSVASLGRPQLFNPQLDALSPRGTAFGRLEGVAARGVGALRGVADLAVPGYFFAGEAVASLQAGNYGLATLYALGAVADVGLLAAGPIGIVGRASLGVAARGVGAAERQIAAAWGAGTYRHGGLMTSIEHIMYRHGSNSGFSNVSRFSQGTGMRDISNYVDSALRHGTVIPTGPGAYTVEYSIGRVIGTNVAGNPASNIRVIVQDGVIRTAFPY